MNLLKTVLGDYWVAEYSVQQNVFNVTSFEMALKQNQRMILDKRNNDYLIFGIFRTIHEAEAACDEMQKMQQNESEKESLL